MTELLTDPPPETNGYDEVQILIIDDDEVSIMAMRRALRKMKLVNPVRVAHDGVMGLEILRGEAGQEQMLPPFIVLLDINMPRMNGHEFLKEVRDDPKLHRALIFVLTTSDAPEDVMRAYDQNIAGYVVKEQPYETFVQTLALVDHVAKLVVLPT
ncbi:MAG: response regulator [Pseudomonadota bacterium]